MKREGFLRLLLLKWERNLVPNAPDPIPDPPQEGTDND